MNTSLMGWYHAIRCECDKLVMANANDKASVSYPSWEGSPGGHALTEVPHDADHDDGRLHVVDLSLRTQACGRSVKGHRRWPCLTSTSPRLTSACHSIPEKAPPPSGSLITVNSSTKYVIQGQLTT